MSSVGWLDNHALAERECRQGWVFEDLVAAKLRAAGLDVVQPEKAWRADVSQRRAYQNEVDLWVQGLRLSVKSRRVVFTCPDDIPSNRNPLFVDTVRKWALKDPEPIGVVCVSQATQAMIWTSARGREHWGVRQAFDATRGYADAFMTADKSLWYSVDTLVEQLHTVWDGSWQTKSGVLVVRANRVVTQGTSANLQWLVGRKFHELRAAAKGPVRRITHTCDS